MKRFLKQHLGIIILIILLLVFPTSLTNQAKLNMRIIVTGLAVDKCPEGYEVTAQIVKNTPGTESPGTSASIEFITSKGETIASALAGLTYKTGKVAAFSHTNFIILGKELRENATQCLDYFIRDKIMKSSTMLLFSEEKACDEIQKTKNVELSVGLGLQKVFLYKERESDALMTTVMEFLKSSNTFAKTSVASQIVLKPNSPGECQQSSESSGSGSGKNSGGSSGESGQESSGSKESSSGSGSTSSGVSSSSSGGGSGESSGGTQFFQEKSPVLCFVNGSYVCSFEDDEFLGYMLFNKKSKTCDIILDNLNFKDNPNSKVSVNIKHKSNTQKLRFENGVPCLDLTVYINNAEINEILSDKPLNIITNEDYKQIENAIKSKISSLMSNCFEKAKEYGADVFGAYELSYKYHYNETKNQFKSPTDFVSKLKLNVNVIINKLDY